MRGHIHTCLATIATLTSTLSGQSEEFYGFGLGPSVWRLDVTTGALLSSVPIDVWLDQPYGWTHDGARIVGIDRAWSNHADRLYSLHPASGEGAVGPNYGNQWSSVAIEWVPHAGAIALVWIDKVYFIDPITKAASFRGTLSGLPWYSSIDSIALHPNGILYGAGPTQFGRVSLYTIDLSAMTVSWQGDIAMFGSFTDLACSGTGVLWGAFNSWSSANSTGLYTIDPVTPSATFRQGMPSTTLGIAFGPAMQCGTYCTAKTSSLGCAPTCAWAGLGSPTASSGFKIRANDVISGTWGSLYYGIGQQAALPFGGGTLCIRGSLRRAGPAWSGGSPWASCGGAWSIDFNEWMATHVAIPAGTTVRAQWLGRDPGYAPPDNWQMSNALEFVLRP